MSSGLPGADYQVFLSFRGPDTRQGFTDCLYHFMVDAGIRVFRDNEKIRPGEKIEVILRAINNSVVCIPIFSKDYASSKWCLRELAEMVEKKKKIMPVFYDVTPDDVKLKTSLYREALSRHENEKEKKQWEKALEEVVGISGWESADNKEEKALKEVVKIKGWELNHTGHAELCKCIVKEVLVNLKVKDRIVTDHVVGIQERVEDMLKYLDVQAPGVRYVGIHGIGGSGKTTLAKILFNQLSASFKACSFLADIRGSVEHGGLESLQKKLICDIQGRSSTDISDTNDGIKVLQQICQSKRILIVLDDVDNRDQIESLAGSSSWFCSGSRIIVTTRDIRVLSTQEKLKEGVLWTLEMKEMDLERALQLFSRHAFGMEYPPIEYLDISREVVNAIGRLPLALVIIGSYLHGKHKEAWEENRSTLVRIPQKNIQKTLMLSYKGLDFRTKQIFLDIACFSVNLEKRNAFYMWESCGFRPEIGIEELISLSLVKIVDDDKFWMHDHLKDLGREIICMEGFFDLGERSRLWDHKGALRILKGKQGTQKVQVLQLSHEISIEGFVTQESFRNLRSIRFLGSRGLNITGNFEYMLSNLRWLSWHSCPGDFKATNLNLESLVILDLSYGNIPNDWKGWNQIKVEGLKVLDLSFCQIDRTPDLSEYGNLERLILENSTVREIDASIGKLKRLKHLNLKGCQLLQGLPVEIGSLRALEEMFLERRLLGASSSSFTSLPETIGNLQSLVILEVVTYEYIAVLPNSFGRLGRLKHLSLRGCCVQKLPDTFGELKKLEHLSLSYCSKIKQLPDSFGNLNSLSSLDISRSGLIKLPDSIGDLEELKVIDMSVSCVRELPSSIGRLKKLEELNAHGSSLEGEIPAELGKLSSLKKLVLSYTKICRLPPSISQLPSLQTLWLVYCHKLEEVPMLPTSLVSFKFDSKVLNGFPDLSILDNLTNLVLNNISELDIFEIGTVILMMGDNMEGMDHSFSVPLISGKNLEFCISNVTTIPSGILGFFSELVSLELGCPDLQWLPQLPSSLSNLILRHLKTETKLTSLSGLKKLSHLKLSGCLIGKDGFRSLAIGGLKQLVTLKVINDTSELDGLSLPRSLHCLCFGTCKYVKKLPDLSRLKSLRLLIIKDCEELSHVPGMGTLESLQELFIAFCKSLKRLGVHLPESLKRLHILSCACLDRLPDLSCLRKLEVLKLERCEELVTIRGLGGLESLEELCIFECTPVKFLGIQLPENLRSLRIGSCPSLKLPDLSCLRNLLSLRIFKCDAIVKIKGLGEMESLRDLYITECNSLKVIRPPFPVSLKTMEISSCISLGRLPQVSHLKNLQKLTLRFRDRLEIPGIEELTWVTRRYNLLHGIVEYIAP